MKNLLNKYQFSAYDEYLFGDFDEDFDQIPRLQILNHLDLESFPKHRYADICFSWNPDRIDESTLNRRILAEFRSASGMSILRKHESSEPSVDSAVFHFSALHTADTEALQILKNNSYVKSLSILSEIYSKRLSLDLNLFNASDLFAAITIFAKKLVDNALDESGRRHCENCCARVEIKSNREFDFTYSDLSIPPTRLKSTIEIEMLSEDGVTQANLDFYSEICITEEMLAGRDKISFTEVQERIHTSLQKRCITDLLKKSIPALSSIFKLIGDGLLGIEEYTAFLKKRIDTESKQIRFLYGVDMLRSPRDAYNVMSNAELIRIFLSADPLSRGLKYFLGDTNFTTLKTCFDLVEEGDEDRLSDVISSIQKTLISTGKSKAQRLI